MIYRHFHDVTYGGKSLGDFGLHVSGEAAFNTPEKVYESVEVPGQNGDLLLDTGRFANIEIKYPSFILGDSQADFRNKMESLFNYLLSKPGFYPLDDSYHPDHFRMAKFKGPIDTEAILLQGANFDLTFEAKPEKYLKSGMLPRVFTANGTITNPTLFPAYPLIRIYGNGTLKLGVYTIVVTDATTTYIDIDGKTTDAFYGATNCNSKVKLTIPNYRNNIYLDPGNNGLTRSGITKVEITPRWWMV